MEGYEKIERRILTVMSLLDERQKRLYLAAEAEAIGWGGESRVSEISGVSIHTISAGKKELETRRRGVIEEGSSEAGKNAYSVKNNEGVTKEGKQRIRKAGGGRRPIEDSQPGITEAILSMVENESYGNPENPLQWVAKSTYTIAEELKKKKYQISHAQVGKILRKNGFTLQMNRKLMQVGKAHPDRNAQFEHINETCLQYMSCGEPVVSVDCKKKEKLGEFQNTGREYHKKGEPVAVLDHDFIIPENGKAVPYGVYDISNNEGFVNVGISSETAQFAVASLRNWYEKMGKQRFPDAKRLYITADGGGSNGSRCRLWKTELQKFADDTGLSIEVSHFPPGTSKWNKIEHRLFSYISMNWRGRPLTTLAVVISLIGSTTTSKGLRVQCSSDLNVYPTGLKVSNSQLKNVCITGNSFHPEWNYTIHPHS